MSKSASIEEIFPLSPLQKGLLFHTLFEPSEEVYFEQLTCELHGRFDEAAFGDVALARLAASDPAHGVRLEGPA